MKTITTEKLAELFKVLPTTPRRAHSVGGHYLGIRPNKLPNRKLAWPLDEVERVLAGGAK